MNCIAVLSHCYLYQDEIGLRNKRDYETFTEYQRPFAYTITSKSDNNRTAWNVTRVMCLGPEEKFLLNGRGEGFDSPMAAAIHVNDILKEGLH